MAHTERAHARLSASGSNRWLNCTPSVIAEEKMNTGDSGSFFSGEGTLAHELAEQMLLRKTGEISQATCTRRCNILKKKKFEGRELYDPEMDDYVDSYVDYVMTSYETAKRHDDFSSLLIEQKIDLTEWIPEGFGSNDAIVVGNGIMEVIDLKYGKGVEVSAENNSQLKLYALGALMEIEFEHDIEDVILTIHQPRLDAISSWTIPVNELKKWGRTTVKPNAEKAAKGEGIQQAGDWCRWCKAKPRCATLASVNTRPAINAEFKDPHLLTDEQIVSVFGQLKQIQDWAESVAKYMLKEALDGKKWAGYKVVEGRGRRVWVDEDAAKTVLSGSYDDEKFLNVKLKGIGDIEKLVTKTGFAENLANFVEKKAGNPTLAPTSDKRPEFNSIQQDFEGLIEK